MPNWALVLNSIRDGSLLERLKWRFHRSFHRFMPGLGTLTYDRMRVKAHAAAKLGRWPNTETPGTYNDHILANMLAHDRCVLKNFITDKEFAKVYVRQKCPELLIPETYAVLRSEEEILKYRFSPPCMIKPTHSSGCTVAHQAGAVDKPTIISHLQQSYYRISREPNYKYLENKIIIEELLESTSKDLPRDWKVHCFFGEPKMIWVISGRGTRPRSRYYSLNWEPLPISSLYPLDDDTISKPSCLNQMIEYARILAQDLNFCRVDMYILDGHIYFGEITFYSGAGSQPWHHGGTASSLDVDRALAPLFEREEADPRALLARAGLMSEKSERRTDMLIGAPAP